MKNIEKIILRFRPKIKTKLYTKNNNFEMVGVIKLMAQHGVEATYKVYNWEVVYVECCIFELRLEFFKELTQATNPFLHKIKINSVYTLQGVCALLKGGVFQKNMVLLPEKNELYLTKAFVGGRVEVFEVNPRPALTIDFNLFYYGLMLQKLPYGKTKIIQKPTNFKIPGFYRVEVDQSNIWPPFLPLKDNGQIKYVCGKFIGIFWFEELVKFELLGGKILKFFDCLVFSKYEAFLNSFLTSLPHSFSRQLTKDITNNLFGSLAVKNWEYKQHVILNVNLFNNLLNCGGVRSFAEVGGVRIVESNKLLIKTTKKLNNLGGAAAITSKGRIMLYELWSEVGFKEVIEIKVDELKLKSAPDTNKINYLAQKYNLKIVGRTNQHL
jgi:hypothetical protein